MFTIVSICNT